MASRQSSSDFIANRYAAALYELSSEAKCVDEVLNDLLTVQEYIKQNNDFKLLIKSPHVSSNEKMNIIKKILFNHSANNLTAKFIKVISNNKRIKTMN